MPPARAEVVVVGALPPPVHGMALVTRRMADRLAEHGPLRVFDISPGGLRRGLRYHATKAGKVLRAAVALARPGPADPARTLYLPSDAGWGMIYTGLLVLLARLSGCRVVLHHHNYSYVGARDRRMALLCRLCGSGTRHVLLCETMERRFRELYPSVADSFVLGNACFVEPSAGRREAGGPLRIGHLANLSRDKGLDLVIEVFERLSASGAGVRLVLAGPCVDREALEAVERLQRSHGSGVEYRGPLDDAAKRAFFEQLDVFLMPSRLREGQPLVVLEALACGVPVIAHGDGCVPGMLGGGAGVVIPRGSEFAAPATDRILAWLRDRELLERDRRNAATAFSALRAESEAQLRRWLGGPGG